MSRRWVVRKVPGFVWIQICVTERWALGSWWAYRDLVRTYALGPLRVMTLREPS